MKEKPTFNLHGIAFDKNAKDDDCYMITKERMFQFKGMNVGNWILKKEEIQVAAGSTEGSGSDLISTVKVFPGFHWDGCTGVGKITESKYTLLASLLHDILYIVKKNSQNPKFTLEQADVLLKKQIDMWQKADGHMNGQGSIYFWGIQTLGWPWKSGKIEGYTVEEL